MSDEKPILSFDDLEDSEKESYPYYADFMTKEDFAFRMEQARRERLHNKRVALSQQATALRNSESGKRKRNRKSKFRTRVEKLWNENPKRNASMIQQQMEHKGSKNIPSLVTIRTILRDLKKSKA